MSLIAEDFEEIKEESSNKWTGIRDDMSTIIIQMGEQCGFCEEYYDEKARPNCPLCPARSICHYALVIQLEARKLRNKVTALIGRIKRVKQLKES